MYARSLRLVVAVVAGMLTLASAAVAVPITFIHEGTGSGTLNNVPFGPSDFTVTALGDTANRVNFGGGYYIDHGTALISITNVGTVTFTAGTRTFVNNGGNIVGFSRAGSGGLDLHNGPTDGAFGTWDMLSSIGPISGTGSLIQWGAGDMTTTGGVLIFNDDFNVPTTFQAIIPEPASLGLLATLGAGLLIRRRR